jgi:2-oxoacid:acceptor oxidoreductase gamma subunit (pyruvate/2-ketoisovalerate family)
MELLDPQEVASKSALEVRGDGKAGGGLVLCFQSFGDLLLKDAGLHVQEWPFFSSARRGANIRSYLRVSRRPVAAACGINRPHISVLMNEAAAVNIDFAQGVPEGGTFILNTPRDPETCARHFGLCGRVITVDGDGIGSRYLGHPIGNVSVYVALAEAMGGFTSEQVFEAFLHMLEKRRVPQAILSKNRAVLEASHEAVRTGVFHEAAPVAPGAAPAVPGYGELPLGAQTGLRLSQKNPTSGYARSGFRLRFEDPEDRCTGCAHCITNCPEGIIHFQPHAEKTLVVTGVDVGKYCKLCAECVEICPEHLFRQAPFEEHWEETEVPTS